MLQRAEPVLYSLSMRPPPLEGPALRVLTWNVASLRSLLKNVRALLAYSQILTSSCKNQLLLSLHLLFAALNLCIVCISSRAKQSCKKSSERLCLPFWRLNHTQLSLERY